MNQTIRTTRYRQIPNYAQYKKTSWRAGTNNGSSVLARKIVVQSFICIVIVFLMIWLQGSDEELPREIISQVNLRVVERNITSDELFRYFTDTWEECVTYLQGTG